jgi:hypothetical protein
VRPVMDLKTERSLDDTTHAVGEVMIDVAISDDTLVGRFRHENVVLLPEQFIVLRSVPAGPWLTEARQGARRPLGLR